jgi:phage replication O-like protein O
MDNYTKFPNDILDALIQYRLTAIQMTAALYVVRKVNGWGKPSDTISVSKMAKDTGYSRRKMVGAVGDLEKLGILSIERNGAGRLSEMRVNTPDDWDKPVTQWSHVTNRSQGPVGHRGVTQRSQGGVTCRSQEGVTQRSHTKERKIIKDTYQKKAAPPPENDDWSNDDGTDPMELLEALRRGEEI